MGVAIGNCIQLLRECLNILFINYHAVKLLPTIGLFKFMCQQTGGPRIYIKKEISLGKFFRGARLNPSVPAF